MCVCVYVCMYTNIYIYIYTHTHTHTHTICIAVNSMTAFLCSVLHPLINKRCFNFVNITIKYLLNEISGKQSLNLIINKNHLVKFWFKTPDNSQSYFNPSSRTPLHALACSRRVVDNVPLDVGEGEVHNPRNIAPDSSAAQRCKGLCAAPRPITCCMRAHKHHHNFVLTPMPMANCNIAYHDPQ